MTSRTEGTDVPPGREDGAAGRAEPDPRALFHVKQRDGGKGAPARRVPPPHVRCRRFRRRGRAVMRRATSVPPHRKRPASTPRTSPMRRCPPAPLPSTGRRGRNIPASRRLGRWATMSCRIAISSARPLPGQVPGRGGGRTARHATGRGRRLGAAAPAASGQASHALQSARVRLHAVLTRRTAAGGAQNGPRSRMASGARRQRPGRVRSLAAEIRMTPRAGAGRSPVRAGSHPCGRCFP